MLSRLTMKCENNGKKHERGNTRVKRFVKSNDNNVRMSSRHIA